MSPSNFKQQYVAFDRQGLDILQSIFLTASTGWNLTLSNYQRTVPFDVFDSSQKVVSFRSKCIFVQRNAAAFTHTGICTWNHKIAENYSLWNFPNVPIFTLQGEKSVHCSVELQKGLNRLPQFYFQFCFLSFRIQTNWEHVCNWNCRHLCANDPPLF